MQVILFTLNEIRIQMTMMKNERTFERFERLEYPDMMIMLRSLLMKD